MKSVIFLLGLVFGISAFAGEDSVSYGKYINDYNHLAAVIKPDSQLRLIIACPEKAFLGAEIYREDQTIYPVVLADINSKKYVVLEYPTHLNENKAVIDQLSVQCINDGQPLKIIFSGTDLRPHRGETALRSTGGTVHYRLKMGVGNF